MTTQQKIQQLRDQNALLRKQLQLKENASLKTKVTKNSRLNEITVKHLAAGTDKPYKSKIFLQMGLQPNDSPVKIIDGYAVNNSAVKVRNIAKKYAEAESNGYAVVVFAERTHEDSSGIKFDGNFKGNLTAVGAILVSSDGDFTFFKIDKRRYAYRPAAISSEERNLSSIYFDTAYIFKSNKTEIVSKRISRSLQKPNDPLTATAPYSDERLVAIDRKRRASDLRKERTAQSLGSVINSSEFQNSVQQFIRSIGIQEKLGNPVDIDVRPTSASYAYTITDSLMQNHSGNILRYMFKRFDISVNIQQSSQQNIYNVRMSFGYSHPDGGSNGISFRNWGSYNAITKEFDMIPPTK